MSWLAEEDGRHQPRASVYACVHTRNWGGCAQWLHRELEVGGSEVFIHHGSKASLGYIRSGGMILHVYKKGLWSLWGEWQGLSLA